MAAVQVGRNYRRRFLVQTEVRVEALYLGVHPRRVWLWALLGATGGAILLGIVSGFNPLLVGLGTIVGFIAPRTYLGALEQRRHKKFDAQLVEAVTLVAGSMRSGMSLLQALEKVTREMGAPIRQEFAYALQENQVGKPIMKALEDMRDRIRSEDLAITVNAIGIAMETGGMLSEVLLKIADTIRARNRIRAKIDSMTAQGRLQGMVMALLPWGLAFMLFLLDRTLMRPMFSTLLGEAIVGIIVALEVAGWLIIRKLVAVDV